MKLAKKLGALTLASTMALTSVPVVLANEVQVVETTVLEETTQIEEVEVPVVYAETVVESTLIITARESLQAKIDEVESNYIEGDYAFESWTALKTAKDEAAALVAIEINEDGTYETNTTATAFYAKLNAADVQLVITRAGLVSLKDLKNAIAAANELNKANYDEEKFDAAVTAAKTTLTALQTETDVNPADTAETAITTLNAAILAAKNDDTKLNDTIADAKAKIASEYTIHSYNAMATKLAAAEKAKAGIKEDGEKYSDEEKQQATTQLSNAISELISVKALTEKVAEFEAETLVGADYTAHSWNEYTRELKEAKQMLKDAQNELKGALTQDAIDGVGGQLEQLTNAKEDLVNVATLRTLVSDVRAKGFIEADYTAQTWTTYTQALNAAQTILNNADYIEIEVELASEETDLRAAAYGVSVNEKGEVTELPAQGLVNIKELKALVKVADKLQEADYVASTWTPFAAALAEAKEITTTNSGNATRAKVVSAKEALVKTQDGLKTLTLSGLKALVAEVKDIVDNHKDYYVPELTEDPDNTSEYNAAVGRWDAMVTKLAAAEVEIAKADFDFAKLPTLLAELSGAKNTVVANPVAKTVIDTLNELVVTVKGYKETEYVGSSWIAIQTKLAAAETVLAQNYAKQADLAKALAELQAVTGANAIEATKTNLTTLINKAELLKAEDYTEESFAVLVTEIQASKVLSNKLPAEADEQKAVIKAQYNKLEVAMKSLVAKDVTKETLQELVNTVKEYVADAFEDGVGTEFTTFEAKLAAAEDVLAGENATQKQVDAAYTGLEAAVKALKAVNKTTLATTIANKAEYDERDYKVIVWVAYEKALANAEALVAGTEEVSADIKEAQANLKLAEAAIKGKDYAKTDLAITLTEYELSDGEASKYTIASWDHYQAKLKVAKKVVVGSESISFVRSIEKALVVAKDSLVKISLPALKAVQTEALAKVEADYTTESWATFKKALDVVDKLVADGGPSSQFRAAENNLVVAIAALEEAEVVVDEEAPVLAYEGETQFTVENGAEFTVPVVTATDNADQEVTVVTTITLNGEVVETIDTTLPGGYIITYTAVDAAGNEAEPVVLGVIVIEAVDTESPVLAYEGETQFTVENGAEFTVPVVTATDNVDQEVTVVATITLGEEVVEAIDTTVAGTYTITYTAVDAAGNAAGAVVITVVVNEAEEVVVPATKENLVNKLFNDALGRPATEEDMKFYVEALESGEWKGAQLVEFFTTSEEFNALEYSDEEYINAVYSLALNRAADADGLAYWVGELANSNRTMVLGRMLATVEFNAYCEEIGVQTGMVNVAPAALTDFIARLYTTCLGREATVAEIINWVPSLVNKEMTGSDIAAFFIHSDEFVSKDTTVAGYAEALYGAFFGAVDQEGVAYWINEIEEGRFTRETALEFFAGSDQFKAICDAAGIER